MARRLITSSPLGIEGIRYPGSFAGSVLPADVYSRFLRARGEQVLFVSAIDEHESQAEIVATEVGLGVADYWARHYETQTTLAEQFGLSFDILGRSSSPQNKEQTQYFVRRLEEQGYIEARSTRQMFSPADGRFLPGDCLIGTCPHCDYDRAGGDWCEGCEQFLEPTELMQPRSAISGSRELEVRESRGLVLLQTRLVSELRAWLESKSDWPMLTRSIGLGLLDEGLKDRCITRNLSWGIPVAWSGFEGKVYQEWFDAPIAYIGATREWADRRGEPDAWREWWSAAEDVQYVQFMTRNKILHHTVGFPCAVIGSGESWKQVDFLKAFDWLTYYGDRFPAKRNVGIRMDQALGLLDPDYWRYYLMANVPEVGETSFTWEAFAVAVNEDLVDAFGGFVERSLLFAREHFDDEMPSGGAAGAEEAQLSEALDIHIVEMTARMSALEFRKAVSELRAAWSCGNAYLARKQPWLLVESDPEGVARTVRTCINLIALFARLSVPLMPFTATRVLDALCVPEEGRRWPNRFDAEALGPGHGFSVLPPLFRRIDKEDVELWRSRFGAPQVTDDDRGHSAKGALAVN